MFAPFSIKSFSRADTWFLKISTVTEVLSLKFQTFGFDKPMTTFSSFSNFVSTDYVKSFISANYFVKIFCKEVKLSVVSFSIGLRGVLVVCGTFSDMSGVFLSILK